jgi:alpha-N-arabinofuranosidase
MIPGIGPRPRPLHQEIQMKITLNHLKHTPVASVFILLAASLLPAQTSRPVSLQIRADQITAKMPPTFHGLMTEEINYAFEGGLYAELIRNRNFKESVPERRNRQNPSQSTPAKGVQELVHWSLVQERGGAGSMQLDTATPLNAAVPASLKLTVSQAAGDQRVGVANDGFWGIPVKPNTTYKAMFYAKADAGFTGGVTLSIVSNDGASVSATAQVPKLTASWKKYEVTLQTGNGKPTSTNRFLLTTNRPGTLWFGFVSLFPPTYKNRPNGFRPDLMELLAAMKPEFLRFPGGNYLEGNTFDTRFNWKQTIGPVEERPGHMNDAWGYWSSDGMGLLEYLAWCEDLNMEPVLAVFAGYSLRGQKVKPGPALDPFIQEALEEIEYLTGDTSTTWGARRAKDGHPAPFKLRYVEVGNEDFFDREKGSYDGRFTAFYDAIKARYPHLQIIESAGFNAASVYTRTPDLYDDHYYRGSDEMVLHANDYESRRRTGPKVMVGEWATRVGSPTPNMEAAIADAANMAGFERNADVVLMHCYAPLFVNVNPGAMQWTTDLIGYNTLTSYGSPAYWAQHMFANHHGDAVVSITVANLPYREWQAQPRRMFGPPGTAPANTGITPATPMPVALPEMFFSVTKDTANGTIYAKVINRSDKPQPVHITLTGLTSIAPDGKAITLSAATPADTNTITEPDKIVPVTTPVTGISPDFTRTFPPNSITVLLLSGK